MASDKLWIMAKPLSATCQANQPPASATSTGYPQQLLALNPRIADVHNLCLKLDVRPCSKAIDLFVRVSLAREALAPAFDAEETTEYT